MSDFMERVEARLKRRREFAAKLEADMEKVRDRVWARGVKASTESPDKTAAERWREKVNALVETGMSRAKAMVQVDRDAPSLRQDMIEEANRR